MSKYIHSDNKHPSDKDVKKVQNEQNPMKSKPINKGEMKKNVLAEEEKSTERY